MLLATLEALAFRSNTAGRAGRRVGGRDDAVEGGEVVDARKTWGGR